MLKRVLLFVIILGAAIAGSAQHTGFVPGDVLVMVREGYAPERIASDLRVQNGVATGLQVVQEVSAPMRAWLFHFDPGAATNEVMLRAFRDHEGVQLAQNNHYVKERTLPDDPQLGSQWQHVNINSAAAWDVTTGGVTASGDTIVVCIIERSDLSHPDLAANAWINQGEVPDNSIDDDGNGYVDDQLGWNTPSGNDNVYATNHGTQVAGMIGAVGDNGLGVAGANWKVKMMPVAYGTAQEAPVLAAYTYPLIMRRRYNESNGATGAFVVVTNASWGIDGGQPADSPLWCAMFDTLGAAGVLSCGATANNQVDVDVVGDMPTACPSDYLISVTATDVNDERTFSAYGLTSVDVGAPGAAVFTTSVGGGFGTANGTSFASPLTAGVVALLYSAPCPSLMALVDADPAAGALHVRDLLFDGVDQVGNLPGATATGGRINAGTSMQLLMAGCGPCPVPYGVEVQAIDLVTAQLSWSVVTGDTFDVRYRAVGAPDWSEVGSMVGETYIVTGLQTCTAYEFQVRVHCGMEVSDYSAPLVWTSEGCCHAPTNIVQGAPDVLTWPFSFDPVIWALGYVVRYRAVGAADWLMSDVEEATTLYVPVQEACTPYEAQIASNCADGIGDWSESLFFTSLGCGSCVDLTYCTSAGQNSGGEWIERIAFNNLDHTSGNDGGYGDHTDTSGDLLIGPLQTLTLVPGFAGFAYSEWWSVWVDLDQDGSFAVEERLYQSAAGLNATQTAGITLPADALIGTTRLRVIMKYGSNVSDACGTFTNGEVEDYCVNVSLAIGMDEQVLGTVRIRPSPADDHIFIELDKVMSGAGGVDLVVQDALGRVVLRQAERSGVAHVSTSAFPDGAYQVSVIRSGRRLAMGRFVVVH